MSCLLNRLGNTALSGMLGQGGVVLRRNLEYGDAYIMYGKLEKKGRKDNVLRFISAIQQ